MEETEVNYIEEFYLQKKLLRKFILLASKYMLYYLHLS